MLLALSQPAAPFANLLILAGLVCIAIAIFGRARETAAGSGFRSFSALTGVLLLFYVYGIYLPRAAHSNDAQTGQPAEKRAAQTEQAMKPTAQTEQALAVWRMQPVAPSAQAAAQNSPLSALEQQTTPSAVQQPIPKGFNVDAARRSGFSDDEILQYLAQTRSFDVDGALRGGYSKAEIIDYLAGIKSAQPVAQAAAEDLFSGRWKNADPKAASILLLRVEERGDEITVRAWGSCLPQQANGGRAGDPAPQYCDWGTGHGVVRDGAATVSWNQGPVLRRMRLLPEGASLRVVLDSTSRGRPQHVEAHFAKSL